jgi:hypothetical protein
MNANIQGIEVTNVSIAELELLIKRFGKLSKEPNPQSRSSVLAVQDNGHSAPSADATDRVALQRLVDAGENGVKTNDIGEILGKRGKSARGAVREWSKRIGLTKDGDTLDAFEDCRVGTGRGLRIRPNLLEVAKLLMQKHQ